MRKVLLIATLSACAATHSAPGTSGSGSGSSSGSGMPACTENCAGSFTVDDTGFIVQGDTWWASTSSPKLTGTIDTNGGTLQVYSGDVAIGTATIANGTWFLELPAGTIPTSGVTLHFELTAPGAQKVTQDQLFQLDNGMPAFTSNSSIRDERGDAISFTTGEPVHTHAGATIDLSNPSCAAVYKYTYLTDVTPKYATETSPNPIAWHVSIASPVGIDDTATSYRVRESDTAIVQDWTSLAPGPDGSYDIELHRDGQHPIADLGTRDGYIFVDVQARDGFGMASTQTYCMNYYRLAPPLEISSIAAEPSTPGESTLFDMTLAGDSPISTVINADGGPYVFSQHFVQHAAEPITVAVDVTQPTGKFALDAADWDVETTSGIALACGDSNSGRDTDQRCSTQTKISMTDTPSSGSLTSGTWNVYVIDDVNGAAASCSRNGLSATCSIPARANGSTPHSYRVVTSLADVTDLAPKPNGGPFGEWTQLNRMFTGLDVGAVSHCNRAYTTVVNGVTKYWCDWATYEHIYAVRSASIAFDAFQIQYAAKVDNGSLINVPYTYPSKSAALTWDAGTDKLPSE